jgi:hypothetical protein
MCKALSLSLSLSLIISTSRRILCFCNYLLVLAVYDLFCSFDVKGLLIIIVSNTVNTCGLLWIRQWSFGFHKRRGISWPADWLLTSHEELSSMKLVSYLRVFTYSTCCSIPLRLSHILSNYYSSTWRI